MHNSKDIAPLYQALREYSRQGRVGFHMPGNRGGRAFDAEFADRAVYLETTELAVTDDLNRPSGPALLAEKMAASFFGAAETLFFCSGSSMAIYTMLSAACPAGGKVFLSPFCHLSAIHAAAILDLDISFLPARMPPAGARSPVPRLDLSASSFLMEREEKASVFLTSPDYYGCSGELAFFAEETEKRGFLLLVDEAHAAHFAASRTFFPAAALSLGADMVVQSAHKTLPVLAPASLLHLSDRALRRAPELASRARKYRCVYQTSSPSFPITASLDFARSKLRQGGPWPKEETRLAVAELRKKNWDNLLIYEDEAGEDPLRLVIRHADLGLELGRVAACLNEHAVDPELMDLQRLVLIVALDQEKEDFRRLAAALDALSKLGRQEGRNSIRSMHADLERRWQEQLIRPRELQMRPRQALFSASHPRFLSPTEASAALRSGQTMRSAVCLAPYPPGIPLCFAGERLEAAQLELIADLAEAGIFISGMDAGRFPLLPERD